MTSLQFSAECCSVSSRVHTDNSSLTVSCCCIKRRTHWLSRCAVVVVVAVSSVTRQLVLRSIILPAMLSSERHSRLWCWLAVDSDRSLKSLTPDEFSTSCVSTSWVVLDCFLTTVMPVIQLQSCSYQKRFRNCCSDSFLVFLLNNCLVCVCVYVCPCTRCATCDCQWNKCRWCNVYDRVSHSLSWSMASGPTVSVSSQTAFTCSLTVPHLSWVCTRLSWVTGKLRALSPSGNVQSVTFSFG